MRNIELTLRFFWTRLGKVSLDGQKRLRFPRAPNAPGLYRFEIAAAGATPFYIGQTDNLARRFQHYRTPGPSQQTNLRINKVMRETLANNGRILVSVITDGAEVKIDGEIRAIELTAKIERVLLEHAAIAELDDKGIETLNR